MIDLQEILKYLRPGSVARLEQRIVDGVDRWDFSSPESCQITLDLLVAWKDGVSPVTGQELFDSIPAFEVYWEGVQKQRAERRQRFEKVDAVGDEMRKRVKAALPGVRDDTVVHLMSVLWPMLNTDAAPLSVRSAVQTYSYAKQKITELQNAPFADVEAYDPANDPNW